ncbi:hypothetical protein BCR43DRAFT_499669 [Syncephalastrum racemosum]|uniref:Uncharacterized protein n=1 Tax=Syncephalastrum racemosum TaxID=13706 RepID=A0A1X2GZC9_SYNRA|nr:hypothetical protein BCR43DRAFT_499669 [Syncephalastrum racemosum]
MSEDAVRGARWGVVLQKLGGWVSCLGDCCCYGCLRCSGIESYFHGYPLCWCCWYFLTKSAGCCQSTSG